MYSYLCGCMNHARASGHSRFYSPSPPLPAQLPSRSSLILGIVRWYVIKSCKEYLRNHEPAGSPISNVSVSLKVAAAACRSPSHGIVYPHFAAVSSSNQRYIFMVEHKARLISPLHNGQMHLHLFHCPWVCPFFQNATTQPGIELIAF